MTNTKIGLLLGEAYFFLACGLWLVYPPLLVGLLPVLIVSFIPAMMILDMEKSGYR